MKLRINMIRAGFCTLAILFGMISVQAMEGNNRMKPVPTQAVEAFSQVQSRSFPGEVRAFRRVSLGFNVPGQLEFLHAAEGAHVKAGELIAKLDPRDYQFRLDTAEANYKRAKAEYDRNVQLFKDKVISKSQIDAVEAGFLSARAAFDIAKKAFEDTSLHAPFDARIAKRFYENYEHVGAKKTVIALEDIDEIEVIINIPGRLFARTKKEDILSIHVRFDADPSLAFPAEISEYSLSPSRSTRTYEATVKLHSPEGLNILTGMTACVEIDVKSHGVSNGVGLVKIPSKAVFSPQGDDAYVWVIPDNGGIVEKRKIRIGKFVQSDIEVLSGLQLGELVAVAGVYSLEEGNAVRPSKTNSEGLYQ